MAESSRPQALVQITKQGWWRGVNTTFQNDYWLSGTPSGSAMQTIINGLKDIEDTLFPTCDEHLGVGFVDGKLYGPGNGPPIAEVQYNQGGGVSTSTGFTGPSTAYGILTFQGTLENALEVRSTVNGLSKTGKPIHLRKLFRGIACIESAGADSPINSNDLAAIHTNCLPWVTGIAGTSFVVVSPKGSTVSLGPTAQPYIVNRQKPRGRKRKAVTSNGVTKTTYQSEKGGTIHIPALPDLFNEPIQIN